MSASERTEHQAIVGALRLNGGVKAGLDWLEDAANAHIRNTMPWFRYPAGELHRLFLDDLVQVVSRADWRPGFERTADQLRAAASHICKAIRLVLEAGKGCPTYAAIPLIVWECTPEARREQQRIAALPGDNRLWAAVESLRDREGRRVIDPGKIAPDFLKAMLVYAVRLDQEAARIDQILKARDPRYDRLGPILNLIRDVQGFTGRPHDAAVARLLTHAFEDSSNQEFFSEQIRKLRKRHLTS